jgi:hypothetical protein
VIIEDKSYLSQNPGKPQGRLGTVAARNRNTKNMAKEYEKPSIVDNTPTELIINKVEI